MKDIHTIERIASIEELVFDKTGTLTESEGTNIDYSGTPLDKGKRISIASLLRHSKHPLSCSIYKHITEKDVYKIHDFKEIPVNGFQAYVNDNLVKVGV